VAWVAGDTEAADASLRAALRLAPEDRPRDVTGERSGTFEKRVGPVFVEPERLRHGAGELHDPARDEGGVGAIGLHRGHERPAAPGEPDALVEDGPDEALIETLQQGDPFEESRLEIELAVHRPRRDRGHLLADASGIGQFVDAFLADHGRIHVRQKELLLPHPGLLHGDIDAQRADVLARLRRISGKDFHSEFSGFIGGKPDGLAAAPCGLERGDEGGVERRGGVADERDDEHGPRSSGVLALAEARGRAYSRPWDTPPQRGAHIWKGIQRWI